MNAIERAVRLVRIIRVNRWLSKAGKKLFNGFSREEKEQGYHLSKEKLALINYCGEVVESNSISKVIQIVNSYKPAIGNSIAIYNKIAAKARVETERATALAKGILAEKRISKSQVKQLKIRRVEHFVGEIREAIDKEVKMKTYKPQERKSDEELVRSKAAFMQGIQRKKSKEKGIGR